MGQMEELNQEWRRWVPLYAKTVAEELGAITFYWRLLCAQQQSNRCCQRFCLLPERRVLLDIDLAIAKLDDVGRLSTQQIGQAGQRQYLLQLGILNQRLRIVIVLLILVLNFYTQYSSTCPHFLHNLECESKDQKDIWVPRSLHGAIFANDRDLVFHYLSIGADINSSNDLGLTGVHVAVLCGHSSMITLLLRLGAKSRSRDINGDTPLSVASSRNDVRTQILLLSTRSDPLSYHSHNDPTEHTSEPSAPEASDHQSDTSRKDTSDVSSECL